MIVTGISHDNGEIAAVTVNGARASIVTANSGVIDWQVTLKSTRTVTANATDKAGNVEKRAHRVVAKPISASLKR